MEILSNVIEKIEIQWEVKDEVYPYMDTFTFTKEEYDSIDTKELEQMKIDKYNKWKIYMLKNK